MNVEELKENNRVRWNKESSLVAQVVDELMDKMNLNSCVYYDKCRDSDHCDVRRVVQHTLFHHYKFTWSQIARNIGQTHASVIHNVEQCAAMIKNKDQRTMDLIRRMSLEDASEGVL